MAVISYGGDDEFNALAYGYERDPRLDQFIQQSIEQVSTQIGERGMQFINRAKEMFEEATDSNVIRRARALARHAAHLWQADAIRPLEGIDDLQQAPQCMQRYIMANPTVRTMYHNDQVEGYRDTYVDLEPKAVHEDHYDYRRVMDGLVVEDGEDFVCTEYYEELRDGDRDLMVSEQVDIMYTWDRIEALIKANKDDPTSVWNSSL